MENTSNNNHGIHETSKSTYKKKSKSYLHIYVHWVYKVLIDIHFLQWQYKDTDKIVVYR